MSGLTRRDLGLFHKVIKEGRNLVNAPEKIDRFLEEHAIGQGGTAGRRLTATDRASLRALLKDSTGLDLKLPVPKGSRVELATHGAFNEKLGRDRPLARRVVCTAYPGPIIYDGEAIAVVADAEYRLDIERLDPDSYGALLVIENHESFLAWSRLQWRPEERLVIVYRGHDDSLRAGRALAERAKKEDKPVIQLNDVDPAGIDLLLNSDATHALVPTTAWLSAFEGRGFDDRAAAQLARKPWFKNAVEEDLSLSEAFREYAHWVLAGRAISEEGLVAQAVPLRVVPVRNTRKAQERAGRHSGGSSGAAV